MQNDQFSRLLKFAQRTGDRVIVTDASGKEPIVILPLAEYESLMDAVLGAPEDIDLGEDFDSSETDWAGEEVVDQPKMAEPPLHVIEREEVSQPTPRPQESAPVRQPEPKNQPSGGEERFYLEPI